MTGGSGEFAGLVGAEMDVMLRAADAELAALYPGPRPGRQPVHTAYVPANAFRPDLAARWSERALAMLAEFAPSPASFAAALGLDPGLAGRIRELVTAKLAAEPIEDVRIDFEDGYQPDSADTDSAEDRDATAAAADLAGASAAASLPTFSGIRIKSLEAAHGLRAGQLGFEIQVETPQLVLGPDGSATVARCVHAAAGRLTGLAYGTYDYSAALGISAGQQSLEHPVADHARAVMRLAAAGTGVRLSDGSSNLLPAGDRQQALGAWRLHARLVLRSLERGFYQGRDLHPGQLVSRYAATFQFYRADMEAACARLRDYRERAAAGLEEPTTGLALAGFCVRGLDCGAFAEAEIAERAGLDSGAMDRLRAGGPPGA